MLGLPIVDETESGSRRSSVRKSTDLRALPRMVAPATAQMPVAGADAR